MRQSGGGAEWDDAEEEQQCDAVREQGEQEGEEEQVGQEEVKVGRVFEMNFILNKYFERILDTVKSRIYI